MLAFITRLVMRLAAIRWLFKLGGLALLLPLAALLKMIGLPLLLILGVLGFPVIILLFLFGLPIFAVLAVGGLIIGGLGMLLMLGLAAIKFAIFVVLPIWIMWSVASWIWSSVFCRRDRGDDAQRPAEPVDPVDPGIPPEPGIDTPL